VSAITLLCSALILGAAGPVAPECRPLLGPRARVGRWGLLRVKVTNSSPRPGSALLFQKSSAGRQSAVLQLSTQPGQVIEKLILFRPLLADRPLMCEAGGEQVIFPGRVARGDTPAIVVVGNIKSSLGLPIDHMRAIAPQLLPAFPAAYEGVDLLLFGDFDAGSITPGARKALRNWFLSGGRIAATGPELLLSLGEVFLDKKIKKLPSDKTAWLALAGPEAGYEKWSRNGPRIVVLERGFGRLVIVAGPSTLGKSDMFAELYAACGAGMPLATPLASKKLFGQESLRNSYPGSALVLRWSLGALLFICCAYLLLNRRSKPGRGIAAAVGATVLSCLFFHFYLTPLEFRSLSVRVDEFSADGRGTRVREYLLLEHTGSNRDAELEVQALPGVLPSIILYEEREAGGVSCQYQGLTSSGGMGAAQVEIQQLRFSMPSVIIGASYLPRIARESETPRERSKRIPLESLKPAEVLLAIAESICDRNHRSRAQGRALAELLWEEVAGYLREHPESSVSVCALQPLPVDALQATGSISGTSLGRVGIFYGDRR
jgi:hypothetical protein